MKSIYSPFHDFINVYIDTNETETLNDSKKINNAQEKKIDFDKSKRMKLR